MPHPARAPERALFADLSSNNANEGFNQHEYRSAGHLAVMLKATEGTGYVNPFHTDWAAGAHSVGLSVFHYHFCRPSEGAPAAEMEHFWANVRQQFRPHVDRLVYDLEETATHSIWAPYLRNIDTELHRITGGLKPACYTFASALGPLRVNSGNFHVAAWSSRQPSGRFRQVPGGRLWAWQYTDGPVDPSGGPRVFAGIGECDGNVLAPEPLHRLRKVLGR